MDLIELHILQSFPVTCLNRDDVGAPKTAFFGGCPRARVSSQSWKRAIRLAAKQSQNGEFFQGQRTRYVVKYLEQAFGEKGLNESEAAELAQLITKAIVKKLDDPEKGNVKTLLFFSPAELAAVVDAILAQDYKKALKEKPKTKKGKKKSTLNTMASKAAKQLAAKVKDAADIAIFGRMVADDHSLMVEGAGMFSHALSTHCAANEIDFFSAVDDLQPAGEEGAGHIGTLEFNSACYYRYVGLNLDLLRDEEHLSALSPQEFKSVVETFLKASITAVPQARKNSMFGHNLPGYVLGLRRTGQPLSLANAFEKPVRSQKGYLEKSVEALERHWKQLKETYDLKQGKEVKIPEKTMANFIKELLEEI